MLAAISPSFVRAGTEISDTADAEGWRTVTCPIGALPQAASEFLRFGAEAEVLEPPELRAKMAEITTGLRRLYGD
ncbi:MAG TPA: WYL domain-containing protein [Telmatospirillum sp.]|nr:WYL domain-containing protein [Telmatospirillum sp.]